LASNEDTMTREKVVQRIRDSLNRRITLEELVRWAEEAMMEGEFEEAHLSSIRDAVARPRLWANLGGLRKPFKKPGLPGYGGSLKTVRIFTAHGKDGSHRGEKREEPGTPPSAKCHFGL